MSNQLNKARIIAPFQPILESIPDWISKWPYDCCYNYLRRRTLKLHPALWARNSYRLNNLIFLLSDLDLTLIVKQKLNKNERQELKHILKTSKRLFPVLGEINVYDQTTFHSMLSFANPLELRRDPDLITYFSLEPKSPSSLQVSSFLVQLFFHDRHQLMVNPNLRLKKWQHHFSLAQNPLLTSNLNQNEFLKHFLDCLDRSYFNLSDALSFFESFLMNNLSDLKSREILIFYPQWWVSFSVMDGEIYDNLDDLNLGEREKEIIGEHLNWEIWGLYTQLNLEDLPKDLLLHISKLLTLCSALSLIKQEQGLLFIQSYILNHE